MKPYTYSIIKGDRIISTKVIDILGGPAPVKAPSKKYRSLSHQLCEDSWNLFDATIRQPYGIKRAERNSEPRH